MTQKELIEKIAEEASLPKKHVKEVIDAFEKVVMDEVSSGEMVVLPGFVKFERHLQKGRAGKVPGTDRAYKTEDKYVPKMQALKHFKDKVAGA